MLNIYFGSLENEIYKPGDFFDVSYETDWLSTPFAKRCIREIDKSEHIKDNYIESPYLGAISPIELSGGVKTLIMLESNIQEEEEVIFNASACGNNCAKFLLELAKTRDIFVTMHHSMTFPEPFEVKITNNDKIVSTNFDLIMESNDLLYDYEDIGEFLKEEYGIESK